LGRGATEKKEEEEVINYIIFIFIPLLIIGQIFMQNLQE
jgi:hypothetical protein